MPRPPLRGEPADHVLRFRVTRSEYATLAHYACSASVTVTQLLSEAVAEYTGDLAERDGTHRVTTNISSLTP